MENEYIFDPVTGNKRGKFLDKLNKKKLSSQDLDLIFLDSLEENSL